MLFGFGKSPIPVIRPLRPDKVADCARLHAAEFAHPWSAEEIAALTTYLAGPEAGFVTGASWTIDGGFTA